MSDVDEVAVAQRVVRVDCPIDWPDGQRCLNYHEAFPCKVEGAILTLDTTTGASVDIKEPAIARDAARSHDVAVVLLPQCVEIGRGGTPGPGGKGISYGVAGHTDHLCESVDMVIRVSQLLFCNRLF